MDKRIVSGLVSATAVVLLPLLLCGMALPKQMGAPVIPEGQKKGAAEMIQDAEKSPRRVRAIIVHQAKAEPSETQTESQTGSTPEAEMVTVEVAGTPEEMSMEDYLTGVLLGEMPASFEVEALKAQAVAARTYTWKQLACGKTLSDDPGVCQAYISLENAEEKLGVDWETLLEKIRRAVQETAGQVLTYDGELITATYFSCSGGRTESAQAVWGGSIPYLVSVDSPGEENSGDYETTVTKSLDEVRKALSVEQVSVSSVTYTEGGGVDTMEIDERNFSGTELRKLLGLKSTWFTMELTDKDAVFHVRGYGHRVGMSQDGAEAMALSGFDYAAILSWYYPGTKLETWK